MSELRDQVKKIEIRKRNKATPGQPFLGLGLLILIMVGLLFIGVDLIRVNLQLGGWISPVGIIMILVAVWGLICLGQMLAASVSSPSPTAPLSEIAKKFEEENYRISGRGYGQFLIILQMDSKAGIIGQREKKQIITVLHNLIFKKEQRISGQDYVELEKKLSRATTDQARPLFSKAQREKILGNYEILRAEIRDRRLEV